jgi:type I restriction enzyme, S subunit
MEVWNSVLSDCVEKFFSGGTPSKSNESFWLGTMPWVSSGEMTQSRISDTKLHITHEAGKIIPAKTVLVVVRGMSLAKEFRVSLTQKEMAFNQDLKALIPLGNVDSTFLFYSLYGRRFEIRKLASESGHGTKKLDTRVLEEIPIFLPSLPLQKKIAAVLSAYDDLIENNNRRIALLEKMAEEIYREWFVRLRFPGHEGVAFHKGIPEGWSIQSIGNLCSKVTDGSHTSPSSYCNGMYMASVKDMRANGFSWDSMRTISEEDFRKLEKADCKPLKNDVLIAKDGSYLKHVFVCTEDQEVVLLSSIAILRPDLNKILPHFFSLALKQDSTRSMMSSYVSGSALPRIILNDFKKMNLLIPSLIVLKQFESIVENICKQIRNEDARIVNLGQTRDRLLTRLISGKLSVEDLDIQFPPSMTEKSQV